MGALTQTAADIMAAGAATSRRRGGLRHGTPGGYSYHRCRCVDCLRAYRVARGGTPDGTGRQHNRFPPRPPAACGTRSGYLRHRNAGEAACDACLAAAAAYQQDRRALRKGGRS